MVSYKALNTYREYEGATFLKKECALLEIFMYVCHMFNMKGSSCK